MRNFIVKKAITRKGYFDRVLLVSICQNGAIRYLFKKIYKKLLRLARPKVKKWKKPNPLEQIGYCFEPIGIKSKLKGAFKKKRVFRRLKTIEMVF